jgi:transcription-repair coupling factor (superfamily II helicase)
VRETVRTEGADPRARVLAAADAALHPSTRTRALIEQLERGEEFFGAEALAPAFHARMAPISEYLPAEARWLVLDRAAVTEAAGVELEDARARFQARRDERRIALEPAEHYLEEADLEALLDSGRQLLDAAPLELHGDESIPTVRFLVETNRMLAAELARARAEKAEELLRPLVAHLRGLRGEGFRVALVCASVASGERLKKLLAGYNLEVELRRQPGGEELFALPPGGPPAIFIGPLDLLKLYAQRQALPGHAYPPSDDIYREFEATTWSAAADGPPRLRRRRLRQDRGRAPRRVQGRPRRQAGRGAGPDDGARAAALPTFRERLKGYPVTSRCSRACRRAEQKRGRWPKLAGKVDIVIGTHRLLSDDVRFKDLGLVVVDEEQRFGVAHKERLKQLRTEVDVLTLSATPIPRTLHMALAGVRDISRHRDAAGGPARDPTFVRGDDGLVREAILRELARGGQVFFVHNRVETIEAEAEQLPPPSSCPGAHRRRPRADGRGRSSSR